MYISNSQAGKLHLKQLHLTHAKSCSVIAARICRGRRQPKDEAMNRPKKCNAFYKQKGASKFVCPLQGVAIKGKSKLFTLIIQIYFPSDKIVK